MYTGAEEAAAEEEARRRSHSSRSHSVGGKNPQTPKTPKVLARVVGVVLMSCAHGLGDNALLLVLLLCL